jgi:hypothetical protein
MSLNGLAGFSGWGRRKGKVLTNATISNNREYLYCLAGRFAMWPSIFCRHKQQKADVTLPADFPTTCNLGMWMLSEPSLSPLSAAKPAD